jgi:signal peptide peptidase SppA
MSVTEKLAAKLPKLVERDHSPVVAVVKLHGVISPGLSPLGRGALNLAALEPALTKAFEHDRLLAVALSINSPGGAATQSALVAERIRELAERHNVPVLAFCEDVAASGGYWLACAADEIFAHATSQIGSIGVVSSGFGLHGLLERLGVERRLHTAGEHKARLDMFSPEKPEDVAWLQGLQGELHALFADWVTRRRGARLNGSAEADNGNLFTGEVWTGAKALELGLVDGLGTLRAVIGQRYPDAKITVSGPRKPLLARLGLGDVLAPGAAAGERFAATIDALEQRGLWGRFGL